MSAPRPSFDVRLIDTPAGSLPCIVRPPLAGPQLLIVPPLFEEMNRTRALLAAIGRRLTERGIGSWLPDLPGTGDSDLPLGAASWTNWRAALASMSGHITTTAGNRPHLLSIRGGALLDDAASAASHYRVAPIAIGDRQLREMLRTRLAADQERGTPTTLAALEARLATETVELGGYPIVPALAADLRAAIAAPVAPLRTAAVGSGEADRVIDGPPVWRQAEPAAAPALAAAIADDLADWIATCAGR